MRATRSGSAGAEGDTSPLMPHTTGKRYAVVSCHVERPLDDERVGALLGAPGAPAGRVRDRGADAAGRRRGRRGRGALGRAGAGSRRARPARAPHALDRARSRAARRATEPARACSRREGGCASSASRRRCSAAAAGTRTRRSPRPAPSSATSTARRARRAAVPRRRGALGIARGAGARSAFAERVCSAIPTTHSLGDLARALARPRSLPRCRPRVLPRHRPVTGGDRSLLAVLLPLLSRLATPTDLDALAASLEDRARGRVADGRAGSAAVVTRRGYVVAWL